MGKKKYFISADLEGICDVTAWCETEKGCDGYAQAQIQMSRETAAACEAILEAGHEVVVRDGHDSARNILHDMLPRGVKLMRGWANDPGEMMAGIDESYAGALYIGYHSPAGSSGSPLAHTINKNVINWMKINGKTASEFTLNSLYAAQMGVPSVFISGDAMMCSLAKEEVPGIVAAAVKEGMGDSTINMHPADVCRMIKEYTAAALTLNIPVRTVPDPLVLEINLKHHQTVRAALALPGVEQTDESTVRYIAHSPREINVMRVCIMRE